MRNIFSFKKNKISGLKWHSLYAKHSIISFVVISFSAVIFLSYNLPTKTVYAGNSSWVGQGNDNDCGGSGTARNWSCSLNWEGGIIPGLGDAVSFGSSNYGSSVVDAGFGGTIGSLSVGAVHSGSISLNRDLTITGNLSSQGNIGSGSHKIIMSGDSTSLTASDGGFDNSGFSVAINITGTNVNINEPLGTNNLTIDGSATINGNFNSSSFINNGTVDLSSSNVSMNTLLNNGTINSGTGTVTFNGPTCDGALYYTTGGATFYNLKMSSPSTPCDHPGGIIMNDSFTISNDLSLSASWSGYDYDSGAASNVPITITLEGNLTMTGGTSLGNNNTTINMVGDNKTITKTKGSSLGANFFILANNITIDQPDGYYYDASRGGISNMTIGGSGNTVTLNPNVNDSFQSLTVDDGNQLDIAGGLNFSLVTNNGNISSTGTGDWVGGNLVNNSTGIFKSTPSNLNLTTMNNSGTFLHNTGTVTFNGSNCDDVKQYTTGGATFYNLKVYIPNYRCSQSGRLNLNDSFAITNNLTEYSSSQLRGGLINPSSPIKITLSGDFNKTSGAGFAGCNLTVDMVGDNTTYNQTNGTMAAQLVLSGNNITVSQTGGSYSGSCPLVRKPKVNIISPASTSCYLVWVGDKIDECNLAVITKTTSINWTVSNHDLVDHIKTEYSINSGTDWTTLSSSLGNDDTTYNWTLPTNVKTSQAEVRVTLLDGSNNNLDQNTSQLFTIHANSAPTITPTAPNDGVVIN